MTALYNSIVHNFFVAFGVILGASVFAGIGATLTDRPPLKAMLTMARSIKIWAMAVALGNTFSSYEAIEKGLFEGEFKSILKQAVYVLSALTGSNAGYWFIRLLQRCGEIWGS